MVLERFRLFGRGKTREQLRQSGESEILKRDIDAIRTARRILLMRELGLTDENERKSYWKGLSNAEKTRRYEQIRDYLLEMPTHLDNDDEIAKEIQAELNRDGKTVEHAIEGAEYFFSLGSKKSGKVKEVKLQKFQKGAPAAKAKGKGRVLMCPVCHKTGRGTFELHKIAGTGQATGTEYYHCNSCGNVFVFDEHERLIPIHPGEYIPEVCPSPGCGTKLEAKPIDKEGKIFRLQCTNPNCRGGGGLQPWFIDLSEGDYKQWLGVRKQRLNTKLDVLKAAVGYDKEAKDRKGLRIKREIERMKKNIDKIGLTDINYKRLGLIDMDMDEDSDEYKQRKAQIEAQYGFNEDDYKRMHVNEEEFKKAMEEVDEKTAGEYSKKIREDKEKELAEAPVWMKKTGRAVGTPFRWTGKVAGKGLTATGKAIDKGAKASGLHATGGFFNRVTRYGTKSTFSIVLAAAGIVLGAFLSWPFTVALAAWAARNILPTPGKFELQKDFEGYRWGSLFATPENRHHAGLSVTRSLLKLVILFFLGWGFFTIQVEFRGLLLLLFFFTAYFSLPGEYSPSEPEKFMEGIWRPFVAFILAFVVFGGVFQSKEMQWLCLAFFAVFPIATEKENLARALGHMGSGIAASYENLDKIIFIILMIVGLISVIGGSGLNIDFGTVAGNIFFPFWIVSLIGGLTSPANVRPYTGIVMLVMVFIFFATGPGEQIVGQGFFGAWWPTMHNTMTAVLTPMGEALGSVWGTFGQTFNMLVNPMQFAENIMEGSYEENPTGLTGSYGVEIKDIVLPVLYPGTQGMATFNVENVGPAKGGDVRVEIELPDYLQGIVRAGTGEFDNGVMQSRTYYDSRGGNDQRIEEFANMSPSFIVPLFFMIDAGDCETINKEESALSRLKKRNEYIPINLSVEYDYEVSSFMPLTVISNQEWQERTARGTFTQAGVISHITTSPAKLSIGSFDQPIISGNRPFYIGFNLTSEEGPNSRILWEDDLTKIVLEIPSELIDEKNLKCTPSPSQDPETKTGNIKLTWNGEAAKNKAILCFTNSLPDIGVPTKTYSVRAYATFRFRKWTTTETRFAFSDACPNTQEGSVDSGCTGLDEQACRDKSADCTWGVLPGASEASCNPLN